MFESGLPNLLEKYKFQIVLILVGLILIVAAGIITKNNSLNIAGTKVEVLSDSNSASKEKNFVVEISGAVESPGVYNLSQNSRIEDLLIRGGGLSVNADRDWVEKNLNRAAKLIDGQKVFIPSIKQTNVLSANNQAGYLDTSTTSDRGISNTININSASKESFDTLPGIGPVSAQKIIEQRPYSTVDELVSKKVISQSVFDKLKDKISVY